MKFPISGFILKNDMSADKTAFHRGVKKKKTGNLEGFLKNLWHKNHQLETNYLPDLSNISSSNMPNST
jgi:hypothetical protein